jgi:hypothetical protein
MVIITVNNFLMKEPAFMLSSVKSIKRKEIFMLTLKSNVFQSTSSRILTACCFILTTKNKSEVIKICDCSYCAAKRVVFSR